MKPTKKAVKAAIGLYESRYIVQLQEDMWLAAWTGDPGRTLVKGSAKVFSSIQKATKALANARSFSQFKDAKIVEV